MRPRPLAGIRLGDAKRRGTGLVRSVLRLYGGCRLARTFLAHVLTTGEMSAVGRVESSVPVSVIGLAALGGTDMEVELRSRASHPVRRSLVTITQAVVIAVILLITAAVLWPVVARRKRSARLQDHFGPEYAHAVSALGSEARAQNELEGRRKHVAALNIRPLTAAEGERCLSDWKSVQSKFVDEPGQAIVDADRLIMDVMQTRAYPAAEFEQRAADLSVTYPALVGNYRAARAIAVKNEEHLADTEELRQAMIYYRSLFEGLSQVQSAVVVGRAQ